MSLKRTIYCKNLADGLSGSGGVKNIASAKYTEGCWVVNLKS